MSNSKNQKLQVKALLSSSRNSATIFNEVHLPNHVHLEGGALVLALFLPKTAAGKDPFGTGCTFPLPRFFSGGSVG